ncbi:MAG: hypothetical protein LBC56_03920 [Oscillospiraceae bacterium]|jgi:hypothetical protein|nr:hypothetical protein [Oscillospiraceae bacterium]
MDDLYYKAKRAFKNLSVTGIAGKNIMQVISGVIGARVEVLKNIAG